MLNFYHLCREKMLKKKTCASHVLPIFAGWSVEHGSVLLKRQGSIGLNWCSVIGLMRCFSGRRVRVARGHPPERIHVSHVAEPHQGPVALLGPTLQVVAGRRPALRRRRDGVDYAEGGGLRRHADRVRRARRRLPRRGTCVVVIVIINKLFCTA